MRVSASEFGELCGDMGAPDAKDPVCSSSTRRIHVILSRGVYGGRSRCASKHSCAPPKLPNSKSTKNCGTPRARSKLVFPIKTSNRVSSVYVRLYLMFTTREIIFLIEQFSLNTKSRGGNNSSGAPGNNQSYTKKKLAEISRGRSVVASAGHGTARAMRWAAIPSS